MRCSTYFRLFSRVTAFGLIALGGLGVPFTAWGQTNIFPPSGNAGIGTTSPGDLLDVYRSSNGYTRILVNNPDTTTGNFGTQAQVELAVAGNLIGGIKTTANPLFGLTQPSLFLTTEGPYPLTFGTNASASPCMILDVNGRLGIGNISPAAALDVSGDVKVSGGNCVPRPVKTYERGVCRIYCDEW